MKTKFSPLMLVLLAALLTAYIGISVPAAQAQESGSGELVLDTSPGGRGNDPGPGGPPGGGLEADPDTYQIDSWGFIDVIRFDPWTPHVALVRVVCWILRYTTLRLFAAF